MSRTFLVRTEARGTSGDLAAGLACRVADPLWLLGRQWQIGELLGEDAGSPVGVDLAAEAAMISRFRRAGQTSGQAYDPAVQPLDVLTADPVRSTGGSWTARLRVDTGRELLRCLDEAGLQRYAVAFRTAFELPAAGADLRRTDPAGARLLDVTAGRIPDGEQAYATLGPSVRGGMPLPADPAVDQDDEDDVRTALDAWLGFCDATIAETGASTWVPERLEHGFSVATGNGAGATVLDAEGFHGEHLTWHAFDARPLAKPTGFMALPPPSPLPTRVRFRGMPNMRWWEFEDASVDLGAVDAGPADVARLALLEFALVYANDHFAVPLALPVGSVSRITSLVVTDTFGLRLRVEPAAQAGARAADRWTMFTLTEREPGQAPGGVADLLFLAPVAAQPLTGPPVEDVLMLRDEMANLAWAVERAREGGAGGRIEAIEEWTRQAPELSPPAAQPQLRYRLGTSVPPHWFPLVPQQGQAGVELDLQRMANQPAVTPQGRLLDLAGPPIADAEVPREGLRLLRDYAMARWSNGASFTWARRVRRIGRGEGSSGLRFDAAELEEDEGN
jgi:hypothetical protein